MQQSKFLVQKCLQEYSFAGSSFVDHGKKTLRNRKHLNLQKFSGTRQHNVHYTLPGDEICLFNADNLLLLLGIWKIMISLHCQVLLVQISHHYLKIFMRKSFYNYYIILVKLEVTSVKSKK